MVQSATRRVILFMVKLLLDSLKNLLVFIVIYNQ